MGVLALGKRYWEPGVPQRGSDRLGMVQNKGKMMRLLCALGPRQ